MNCDDIRRLISDDIDEAASPEDAERVRQHLASCTECRALRRQWKRIDRAVKDGPADAPAQEHWDGFTARLEARLGSESRPLRRLGSVHNWGWAVAAVLLVALCVALYVSAYQARRASEAAGMPARLARLPAAAPTMPAIPVADSVGTSTDLKLFHELDLTFDGGVKWVATDGRKIDFGVSRDLGSAPAVAEGPDRVAAVAVSVRRIVAGRRQLANQARIVGRTGCRADFTAQAGGLEFNYECLALIRSDSAARLQLSVGVGKSEGNGYGAASAAIDLRSGQSAEVARVVSDGTTYAIEVTMFVLPVQGHAGATGA